MFITNQNQELVEEYKKLLKIIGSISNLFSINTAPYLSPYAAENVFCKAFGAENVSKSYVSVDAVKGNLGIGIKTFLDDIGKSQEKIAEFNKERGLLNDSNPEELVIKLSQLRNERLNLAKRIYSITDLMYHCITRQDGEIMFYDCPMDFVDISNIRSIKTNTNKKNEIVTITFEDGINEYSFSKSKSTLYKKFYRTSTFGNVKVDIFADPFELLKKLFEEYETDIITGKEEIIFPPVKEEQEHVYLPLYSTKLKPKTVPQASGLNSWNADQTKRARKPNEIYIPIPSIIHVEFNGFFPPRDKSFNLRLPNGRILSARVCQDGGKALMSNPNEALGEWLLRDVLKLKESELLTYTKLEELGIDSVVIYKKDIENYSIDFTRIDSYEKFIKEHTEG